MKKPSYRLDLFESNAMKTVLPRDKTANKTTI